MRSKSSFKEWIFPPRHFVRPDTESSEKSQIVDAFDGLEVDGHIGKQTEIPKKRKEYCCKKQTNVCRGSYSIPRCPVLPGQQSGVQIGMARGDEGR